MTVAEIILLVVLILISSFLAMARSALVNVRKARLRQLIEDGAGGQSKSDAARARTAERLAEDAGRLLATTQLGMMLTSFFAGAVVAVLSAPELAKAFEPWLGTASYPVAFVLVVLVAALIMLILGNLVPEMIALRHSERLALWLARPLDVVSFVAMPIVRLVVWLSHGIARLFGAELEAGMPLVTEEEIKTLVDAGEEEGVIQVEEKRMIYSIFELGDTLTRQVMVPRTDVTALDVNTPMVEALDVIMEAGHSRIPIYEETIDNVVGVLYAKDLLGYLRDGRTDVPLSRIVREAYFIPETKKAGDLLPDLQQRRVHMAIVVDEYGGMAGLVTIEDLLEEIVGEIQDEYDTEEPFVEYISEDEYIFDARVDLDDLNRLMDAELPAEGSDTLGGFIYTELGKVPAAGDRIAFEDLELTVESVAGRRIQKVRVKRQGPVPVQDDGLDDDPTSPDNSISQNDGDGADTLRPADQLRRAETLRRNGKRSGQAGTRRWTA
jgi:putative hemolysin